MLMLSRGGEGKTKGSGGEKRAQGASEETLSTYTSHGVCVRAGFFSPWYKLCTSHHRIIDWFGLEETCKGSSSPAPHLGLILPSYGGAESWAEGAWGCYIIPTPTL